MTARVVRSESGEWEVWNGQSLVNTFQSNRAAWRYADELNMEAQTRREDVMNWINKKD